MARLILACLVAVAGLAAWRSVRRRMAEEARRADPAPVTLRKDPETGVYRPLKDGE